MPNRINIDFQSFRESEDQTCWELPPWGHPASLWALPLFVSSGDHAFPIGTAFFVGRAIRFVVTAAHNISEALKHEQRLAHLLVQGSLPENLDLKSINLWVLYQRINDAGPSGELAFWPLESVDGAPPTDIVFGHPLFSEAYPTISLPLSFSLPRRGEKVWSIGYRDFQFPEEGIPLVDVRNGAFDWKCKYSHKFTVVEGEVDSVFINGFAKGYVDGPCFSITAEIFHAQSGGPVITRDGVVLGVNSAGASRYFGEPKSLISLLYPLLLVDLRFGANMGILRINGTRSVIDLVAQGQIATDGSEADVAFWQLPDGKMAVCPRVPDNGDHIYDSIAMFQQGLPATKASPGTFLVLRKIEAPE
ncbi:trypsin-like peptidase domain-containing protein [Azospirillum argentinense]|uniref:Serine protease n=1 Tax=Azospirillum brasilense TaxID=192 RepID=A0A4D8Q2W6_AZOBR|nr:trypsin-like peptidase domain-containing protein [Azospirillum argentinense]QCO04867.1 hypothetical protein D3867_23710 [Azospirillum argentinense]